MVSWSLPCISCSYQCLICCWLQSGLQASFTQIEPIKTCHFDYFKSFCSHSSRAFLDKASSYCPICCVQHAYAKQFLIRRRLKSTESGLRSVNIAPLFTVHVLTFKSSVFADLSPKDKWNLCQRHGKNFFFWKYSQHKMGKLLHFFLYVKVCLWLRVVLTLEVNFDLLRRCRSDGIYFSMMKLLLRKSLPKCL